MKAAVHLNEELGLREDQTRDKHHKLENCGWLVGWCRDRLLPLICPNAKN